MDRVETAKTLVGLIATTKSHSKRQNEAKKILLQDMVKAEMAELRADGTVFSVAQRAKLAPVNMKNLLTWGDDYIDEHPERVFRMPEFLEWVKETRKANAVPGQPRLKVTVDK